MEAGVTLGKRGGGLKTPSNIVQKMKHVKNASLLVTCELHDSLLTVPGLLGALTLRLEKARGDSVFPGLTAEDLASVDPGPSGQLPAPLVRGVEGAVTLPASVTWSRLEPRLVPADGDAGSRVVIEKIQEAEVLLLLLPDQITRLLKTLFVTNKETAFSQLKERIGQLKGRPVTCILVTSGRVKRKRSSTASTGRQQEEGQSASVSDLCVALRLDAGVHSTRLCCNVHDAALVIGAQTRSIAERPFKQGRLAQDEGLCFLPETVRMGLAGCASRGRAPGQLLQDSDGAGGAGSAANGDPGLDQQAWANLVWLAQLGQWRGLTGEMAQAVATSYPTVRSFFQACRQAVSVSDNPTNQKTDVACPTLMARLADLEVRRGAGVLTTRRRLGPEFARRLVTQFLASDAGLVIE